MLRSLSVFLALKSCFATLSTRSCKVCANVSGPHELKEVAVSRHVLSLLTVSALIMMSLDKTSSFLTLSPDVLFVPARPYNPAIPGPQPPRFDANVRVEVGH